MGATSMGSGWDGRNWPSALVKVVELGGADALTYGLLGYAHAGNDRPVAGESAYRMAILLDPATGPALVGLTGDQLAAVESGVVPWSACPPALRAEMTGSNASRGSRSRSTG